MNENLARKHQIVDDARQRFLAANLAVIAEYRGVDVAGMSKLRRMARESNVHVQVVKNTLAKRAVENTDFACLTEHFTGPLAIAMADDPIAVAKTVSDFAKNYKEFSIQAGAMDGELLTAGQLSDLAKLPSREELLAKLMATMRAPVQNMINTLHAIPSGFLRVLAQVRDSNREGTAEN